MVERRGHALLGNLDGHIRPLNGPMVSSASKYDDPSSPNRYLYESGLDMDPSIDVGTPPHLPYWEWRQEPPFGQRSGLGRATGHHGELIQGVFDDAYGNDIPALVTLPCRLFASEAWIGSISPAKSTEVSVHPPNKVKAAKTLENLIERCLTTGWKMHLVITSNIPVGRGMGSSTADAIATSKAFCEGFGIHYNPNIIAEVAVASESASDSTMYEEAICLFAQRQGRILEVIGTDLPSMTIFGFDSAPDGPGVDTLSLKPQGYSESEKATFKALRGALKYAISQGDARLLGRVATCSSLVNEGRNPTPQFADISTIKRRTGAVGLQVAHSGTVVGLMYEGQGSQTLERIDKAKRLLNSIGVSNTWKFTTGRDMKKVEV